MLVFPCGFNWTHLTWCLPSKEVKRQKEKREFMTRVYCDTLVSHHPDTWPPFWQKSWTTKRRKKKTPASDKSFWYWHFTVTWLGSHRPQNAVIATAFTTVHSHQHQLSEGKNKRRQPGWRHGKHTHDHCCELRWPFRVDSYCSHDNKKKHSAGWQKAWALHIIPYVQCKRCVCESVQDKSSRPVKYSK